MEHMTSEEQSSTSNDDGRDDNENCGRLLIKLVIIVVYFTKQNRFNRWFSQDKQLIFAVLGFPRKEIVLLITKM